MESASINYKLGKILHKITGLQNDKNNSVYLYNDWGYVEFSLSVSALFKSSNKFNIGLNATVRITLIENYWDDNADLLKLYVPSGPSEYKNDFLKKIDGINTFNLGPVHYFNSLEEMKYEVPMFDNTNEGFEKVEIIIKKIFFEKLIPKLRDVLDLKFLDNTINNKVEYIGGNASDYFLNIYGLLLRRMVLAKLTNNVLYENICEFNRSIIEKLKAIPEESRNDYQKNFPIVFETVYERLENLKLSIDLKLPLNYPE